MEIKIEQSMENLILDAAEKLFLELGYASTSTTQIAKAVGCNQALVHYYFRTKENLFNTIFENKFKKFFKSIFEVENLDIYNFEEKIKRIIESHFFMLSENPKMPLLIINELSRRTDQVSVLRERLKTIPEKVMSQLNDELLLEIEAGRVRAMSFVDLIMSIVSLNISLFLLMPIATEIMQLTEEQKQFLINHRKEEHVNIILRGLRP